MKNLLFIVTITFLGIGLVTAGFYKIKNSPINIKLEINENEFQVF